MAEIDWNESTGAGATGGMMATLASWSGATMSAALIGGLIFWGWQLAVRDVAGVPVIRAAAGPMRVAPETPGGERAAHQGLAVNRIAEHVAEGLPAQVVLAPSGVDLTDEDLAFVPAPDPAVAGSDAPASEPEIVADEAPAESEPPARTLAATDLAVAEALGLAPDEVVLASADGSTAGWPRPAPRPMAVAAALTAPAPTVAREVDVASLEPGTRLVQLGAFASAAEARAAWDRLSARFDGYLAGKDRVVQPANSGDRSFWRLRAAGFADLADARRFCAALVARQAECIPAVVR